jgi:hypothetical protein
VNAAKWVTWNPSWRQRTPARYLVVIPKYGYSFVMICLIIWLRRQIPFNLLEGYQSVWCTLASPLKWFHIPYNLFDTAEASSTWSTGRGGKRPIWGRDWRSRHDHPECSLNAPKCTLNAPEYSLDFPECSLNASECSLNDPECSLPPLSVEEDPRACAPMESCEESEEGGGGEEDLKVTRRLVSDESAHGWPEWYQPIAHYCVDLASHVK